MLLGICNMHMQYVSQEHLKTVVLCKIWGANKVYYGECENREWGLSIPLTG